MLDALGLFLQFAELIREAGSVGFELAAFSSVNLAPYPFFDLTSLAPTLPDFAPLAFFNFASLAFPLFDLVPLSFFNFASLALFAPFILGQQGVLVFGIGEITSDYAWQGFIERRVVGHCVGATGSEQGQRGRGQRAAP